MCELRCGDLQRNCGIVDVEYLRILLHCRVFCGGCEFLHRMLRGNLPAQRRVVLVFQLFDRNLLGCGINIVQHLFHWNVSGGYRVFAMFELRGGFVFWPSRSVLFGMWSRDVSNEQRIIQLYKLQLGHLR